MTDETHIVAPAPADDLAPASTPPVATGPMDLWLIAATIALVAVGLVMIYSSTIGVADVHNDDPTLYLRRQISNIALGSLMLVIGVVTPYRAWRRFAYPVLLGAIGLMLALLFFGTTYGRSTRWLNLGFMNLQPSEVAKFAFIVYLARSIADKTERMRRFSVGFLPHVLVLVVIMLLSLAQPDLGTCLILGALLVMMLFVAGTRISFILAMGFVAAPIVAKLIAGSSARVDRILAFIDPWSYRYDEGFQVVNALTALGSGGLLGRGLGTGHQTMGGFLPEAESDFILPVVGEELGFVGIVAVLGLFMVVILRGAAIARRVEDDFGRFLAFGLAMLVGLQSAVNAAVAVGLFPTKGLTLPFVSFGGSSMLMSMLTVGVLLNVSREAVRAPSVVSGVAPSGTPAGALS